MKLIKITDDYYVIVDENAEIEEGDWYVGLHNKVIKATDGKHYAAEAIRFSGKPIYKITHSTDIDINELYYISLQEIKELLGEVDVKKKAEYYYDMMYFMAKDDNIKLYVVRDYVTAYNQAIEDNKEKKYTNEDMLTIRNQLVTILPVGDVNAWDMIQAVSKYTKWLDEYVESIHQPKTEWDVEFDSQGKLKLK